MEKIEYKICSNCKEEFPATTDYFHKNPSANDGLSYLCKDCANERAKRRYAEINEKPERIIKDTRRQRQEKARRKAVVAREERLYSWKKGSE